MKSEKIPGKYFHTRREFMKISGFSAGSLALSSLINVPGVFAKGRYPADKITFVVPYKAGGGYDIYARTISPYLSRYLKEVASSRGGDIIIKNAPAAGGRQGCSLLLHAKPDGNTIGILDTATMTDNIVGEAEIDIAKLTFLQLAASTTKVIVGSPKGFGSWNEVVTAMKKEPVKMAVGSYGLANHVAAIIMNETMGTKFKLINFPGTAENINALIRGDVQMIIASEESVKGLIDAKEVKVLLMFSEVSKYPGVSTIKDLGFPELAYQMSSHRFIVAPPDLEKGPKETLLAALKKATADADFLVWAKKYDVPVRNVYAGDAEKLFLKYKKFYEDLAPILKKRLV